MPASSNRNLSLTIVKRGAIGFTGFVLSPLSWWNDLFVNFPLSYSFAWLIGKSLNAFMTINRSLFIFLFVIAYFFTNLIGFLMIHYSIFGFKKNQRGSVKKQVAASLIYTLIIIGFFGLDICKPEQGCKILPHWVEP